MYLHEDLGALVAGVQRHVHPAAAYIRRVLLENGVQLGVAHCKQDHKKKVKYFFMLREKKWMFCRVYFCVFGEHKNTKVNTAEHPFFSSLK